MILDPVRPVLRWMVYYRPQGRGTWEPLPATLSTTRKGARRLWELYGSTLSAGWDRLRDKGQVRCARVEIRPTQTVDAEEDAGAADGEVAPAQPTEEESCAR